MTDGVTVLCMVEVFLEPLRIVLLIGPLSSFLIFWLGDFDRRREVFGLPMRGIFTILEGQICHLNDQF